MVENVKKENVLAECVSDMKKCQQMPKQILKGGKMRATKKLQFQEAHAPKDFGAAKKGQIKLSPMLITS